MGTGGSKKSNRSGSSEPIRMDSVRYLNPFNEPTSTDVTGVTNTNGIIRLAPWIEPIFSEMTHDPQTPFKIVCLNEGGAVGTTSCVLKFVQNDDVVKYQPTIEKSYAKQIEMERSNGDKTDFLLHVVDTGGTPDGQVTRNLAIDRDVKAFILFYSVIDEKSLDGILGLAKKIEEHLYPIYVNRLPIVMVGTKLDLVDQFPRVSKSKALAISRKIGCPLMEISNHNSESVELVFKTAIAQAAFKGGVEIYPIEVVKDQAELFYKALPVVGYQIGIYGEDNPVTPKKTILCYSATQKDDLEEVQHIIRRNPTKSHLVIEVHSLQAKILRDWNSLNCTRPETLMFPLPILTKIVQFMSPANRFRFSKTCCTNFVHSPCFNWTLGLPVSCEPYNLVPDDSIRKFTDTLEVYSYDNLVRSLSNNDLKLPFPGIEGITILKPRVIRHYCGIPSDQQIPTDDACCFGAVSQIYDQLVEDTGMPNSSHSVRDAITRRVADLCMSPPGMTLDEIKMSIASEFAKYSTVHEVREIKELSELAQ